MILGGTVLLLATGWFFYLSENPQLAVMFWVGAVFYAVLAKFLRRR